MWNFSPRFPWWKKAKDPRDEFWRQIRETKQTYRNTKILTFALIIASATLKSVSLPLNGMLMIWKIQQAMQDDAIPTSRIHPDIYPCNRAEVFIWQKGERKNLSELFVDEKNFQIRMCVLAHRWLRCPKVCFTPSPLPSPPPPNPLFSTLVSFPSTYSLGGNGKFRISSKLKMIK